MIQGLAEAGAASERGDTAAATQLFNRIVDQHASLSDLGRYRDVDALTQRLFAVEDLIRNEAREHLVVLDREDRVVLYLRGTESQVLLPTGRDGKVDRHVLQLLTGAHCLTHNHPVEPGRPIGGTMSLSDVALAQRFGIRQLRVAAPEATYSLKPKVEAQWDESWVAPTERAYGHMRASLDRAMSTARGSPARDVYFYLRVFDFLMSQLAKRLNLRYDRRDQPREDWSRTIPSPASIVIDSIKPTIIDDTEHFEWMSSVLGSGRQ